VAEGLTEWILDETLPPGGLLPAEGELAIRFGVSRTVIREAIRSLASYRLVRIRHGVGSYVNPREAWDVSSALQLFIRSDRDGLLAGQPDRHVRERLPRHRTRFPWSVRGDETGDGRPRRGC